jgi:muramoyltetrapeptide carboxypeptidase
MLAPKLHPGDRVRLVAPAGPPPSDVVAQAQAILTSWGLEPEAGQHLLDRHGFLAGTDDDRLADLNDAFRDPGVRAVVAVYGGHGAFRIAGKLDTDAIARAPKRLIGPTAVSPIHFALWRTCGLTSFVGSIGDEALREQLMSPASVTVRRDPSEISSQASTTGQASGVLLGGMLAELASAVGVGLPRLGGAILFLDDVRTVGIGTIDRGLTQLLRSGALDGVRGVALGRFTGYGGYVDRGWTVVDVLRERLGRLGVPIVGGLPLGSTRAVPLGVEAVLDADAGTLTIGAGVRC